MIPVNERLIISMYDISEIWAGFYIRAGYPVICWDGQKEGNILCEEFFKLITQYSDSIYGVISQTPCTHFAVSGARWWPRISEEDLSISIALAQVVLIVRELCPNLNFWVQENPAGRLEQLIPEFKPYRKMWFNPCDYGDPYTKYTVLWGEFNTKLKRNAVLPLYGSMIHNVSSGKEQKNIRSKTPAGFAQAFFEANK
jgi:hypothetical protein